MRSQARTFCEAVLFQQLTGLLGLEDDRGWGLLADATQRQFGVQRLDVLLKDGRDVGMEEHLVRPVLDRPSGTAQSSPPARPFFVMGLVIRTLSSRFVRHGS